MFVAKVGETYSFWRHDSHGQRYTNKNSWYENSKDDIMMMKRNILVVICPDTSMEKFENDGNQEDECNGLGEGGLNQIKLNVWCI